MSLPRHVQHNIEQVLEDAAYRLFDERYASWFTQEAEPPPPEEWMHLQPEEMNPAQLAAYRKTIPVHCVGCGGTFIEDDHWHNGICEDCWRLGKRGKQHLTWRIRSLEEDNELLRRALAGCWKIVLLHEPAREHDHRDELAHLVRGALRTNLATTLPS